MRSEHFREKREETLAMNPADEISQRERRRILAEDRRSRTYHAAAQSFIDEDRGGRFSVLEKPVVSGLRSVSQTSGVNSRKETAMTKSNHDKVVNLRAHKYQPEEDAMQVAYLYFDMQHYKKKLRLQFLEDIARMKAEGADTEELMSRLIRHERARKVMRDAFDEVADNPRSRLNPSYNTLVELCDEYGINEFKERLLLVRPTDGLEPRSRS
jgi:hypothetical protein